MPEIPPFPPYPGPSAGDQSPPPFPAYPGPSEPQHFQNLVNAVTQVESGGSSTARSPKGAFGAMQVMPATGREMGVTDINNPAQMKAAGEKYLGKLISHYDGDTEKAIAAYNWGPTRVDSLVKRKGEDWHLHLPSMVKDYVGKVASLMGGALSPASAEAATTPDLSKLSDAEIMAHIRGQQPATAVPQQDPSKASDAEIMAHIRGAQSQPAAPAPTQQPGIVQSFLNAVGANPTQNYLPGAVGSQQVGQAATEGIIGVPGQHMEAIGSGLGGIAGGAVAGFPGAAAGSIAGSMVGALGDQYFTPRQGEGLGEHLLGAAGRGALAAGAGKLLEKTIGGIANLRYGPGKAITDPEVAARAARMERQGFEHVTPETITQSYGGALAKTIADADVLTASARAQRVKALAAEGAQALQNVNGKVIPNIGNDYEALGQGLIASAENHKLAQIERNIEYFRPAARAFVKGELRKQAEAEFPSLGPYVDAQGAALREQGINAANVTFDLMNNLLSHEHLRGPTTNIQEAVAALRRTSSRNSQFNSRINQIPGAANMEGQGIFAGWDSTHIPAEEAGTALDNAFKEMEFNPNATEMTFDQLRHQVTNNLALAHTSTNPNTKIAAQRIGVAAQKDLEAMLAGNQEALDALDLGRKLYKSEYLDVFIKSPEAAELAKHDPSQLVKEFFDKDTTIEGARRMDKLVGPEMAKKMQMAKMQKMVTDSHVPNDPKMFSIPTFLTNFDKFDPAVIAHTYGPHTQEMLDVVQSMRDINEMYRSALNTSGTGRYGQVHSQLMAMGKLGLYGGIGFLAGLGGQHVSLPINPIITAALGIGVPTAMARLWFTPKYLKFWTEGLKIDPTKRNAAMLINRWGTKLAAAYAQDMLHNSDTDPEVIPIVPPKGGRPEGGISIIPPGR